MANGTVDNDQYNYHVSFQVIPEQVTILKIPSPMVMFGNTIQNGNTSLRGVWIHTDHNVFIYMQNLKTVPDILGKRIVIYKCSIHLFTLFIAHSLS